MENFAMEIITKTPEETKALGEKLGKALKENDVVALSGELGAGKTTFIKGLAAGLKVRDFVSSPSFIIVNEYSGRTPFYHMDLYRLEGEEDIEDIAVTEYFNRGGVVAIEWAEKLKVLLPDRFIAVTIELLDGSRRKITLKETGTDRLKNMTFRGVS